MTRSAAIERLELHVSALEAALERAQTRAQHIEISRLLADARSIIEDLRQPTP